MLHKTVVVKQIRLVGQRSPCCIEVGTSWLATVGIAWLATATVGIALLVDSTIAFTDNSSVATASSSADSKHSMHLHFVKLPLEFSIFPLHFSIFPFQSSFFPLVLFHRLQALQATRTPKLFLVVRYVWLRSKFPL